jgi:hypothetical protein
MKNIFRSVPAVVMLLLLAGCDGPVVASEESQMKFQRIPLQFIAALGEADATSGNGAQDWGVWPVDPGPRGVRLNRYERLIEAGGVAPAGWRFSDQDWWLEENGLIMESPDFPLAPGQYLVTGDREVTTVLTVHEPDENGDSRWELADDATLYDVTHLGCRSARYTSQTGGSCSPAKAPQDAFRVAPGAAMPPVEGCRCFATDFLVDLVETDDNNPVSLLPDVGGESSLRGRSVSTGLP